MRIQGGTVNNLLRLTTTLFRLGTYFIGFVSSDAIFSVLASSKLSFASYQPIDN